MRKEIMITILCLLVSMTMYGLDPDSPGKKEKKEIIRIFGEETEFHLVPIREDASSIQEYTKEGDKVFSLFNKGEVTGFLLSSRALGRFEYFDYNVIFSGDLSILKVIVLAYRSTHGAGICSKGWLKQFEGYRGGGMTLGKDIDAVSGGTISATSLVKDMERCYNLMSQMKESGMLE